MLCLGCSEPTDPFNSQQMKVIHTLTGYDWERSSHNTSYEGTDVEYYERYSFQSNAKGSSYQRWIYKDGRTEETTTPISWTFGTADFRFLFINKPRYWEIVNLTPEKLIVYETYTDPLTDKFPTRRERKEFTSVKKTKIRNILLIIS